MSSPFKKIKVLHIASEMHPLAKKGGLGDVVGSLPKAQRELGIDSRVLLPLYPGVMDRINGEAKKLPRKLYLPLEWRIFPARLWHTDVQEVPGHRRYILFGRCISKSIGHELGKTFFPSLLGCNGI